MFLSTKQVCDILNIAPNTVKSLVRRGDLPAIRVGCQLRYRPEDIEAYIQRQTINTTETDYSDWITPEQAQAETIKEWADSGIVGIMRQDRLRRKLCF